MEDKTLFLSFKHIMLLAILLGSLAYASPDEDRETVELMQRDINTRHLSERVINLETEHALRLATLEAKLDLITADRVNNNKALEMVLDMMKLIIEIQKQNDQLKTSLDVLKNQIQAGTMDVRDTIMTNNHTLWNKIQDDFTNLTGHMVENDQQMSVINSKIDTLNITLHNQITQLGGSLGISSTVGFTAEISTHNYRVQTNQTLIFKSLLSNYGGGYNSSDGIFYCPVDGLYSIAATIISNTRDIHVHFVKNNKYFGLIYKDNHNTWGSGSGTSIITLQTGDKVWLRLYTRGTYIHHQSSFSAVRVSN